jgi:hypothetical protein
MYNYIAIALLILGLVLLFSVDSIIDKNTSNSTLKTVRDNKNIVGACCVAGAYYSYTLSQKEMNHHDISTSELEVPDRIPQTGEHLPSYNESMATSDVLNL